MHKHIQDHNYHRGSCPPPPPPLKIIDSPLAIAASSPNSFSLIGLAIALEVLCTSTSIIGCGCVSQIGQLLFRSRESPIDMELASSIAVKRINAVVSLLILRRCAKHLFFVSHIHLVVASVECNASGIN